MEASKEFIKEGFLFFSRNESQRLDFELLAANESFDYKLQWSKLGV